MKTLSETAALLEKSRKPSDLAVARYIRANEAKLRGWLFDYMNGAQSREDLLQECLLAVCEAARAPEPEAAEALREVKNAMQRFARRGKAWDRRRVPLSPEVSGQERNDE